MVDLAHAASFRDILFPCMSVNEQSANALAKTMYAHREGQQVRNLGRLGARWDVRACFSPDFGRDPYPTDLWPYGWFRFRDALYERERGYFDHPLFGKAYAQAASWRVNVSERHRDTIFVDISFEEANLDEPTYDLILGSDAMTTEGAENRAATLDTDLKALYPLLNLGDLFTDIWLDLMYALSLTEKVLTYDDVVMAVNLFHKSVTTVVSTYPLIMDPLNFNMQYNITLLRRDANEVARRFAGEGKRLTTWENTVPRTALQIVVMLYRDATRYDEFLKLNGKIENPLWVPPDVYRVYSDFHKDSGARAL